MTVLGAMVGLVFACGSRANVAVEPAAEPTVDPSTRRFGFEYRVVDNIDYRKEGDGWGRHIWVRP